jgi:hypothetical protein
MRKYDLQLFPTVSGFARFGRSEVLKSIACLLGEGFGAFNKDEVFSFCCRVSPSLQAGYFRL